MDLEPKQIVKLIINKVRQNLRTYAMVFAIVFIFILFGLLTNWKFISARNLSNLFRHMTTISFLAIGMTLVIITGNIDLSVGSATGLVSAFVAILSARVMPTLLPALLPGIEQPALGIISTIIAVISAMIIGLLIGAWQGTIVAYMGVTAFIVTLGGMLIFKGLILVVTQGYTIVPIEDSLSWMAQGYLDRTTGYILCFIIVIFIFINTIWKRKQQKEYGFTLKPLYYDLLKAGTLSAAILAYVFYMNLYNGVQIPVIIMAIVAFIFSYLANNTRFGRYAYALGGNKEATRLSGINIKSTVFRVFILMGLLCGVSGVVLTGRIGGGSTTGGEGYELQAIAACVIGGTSLMGGEGTIMGAIIGALIMASLENGMSLMNLDISLQFIIRGLVLIFAVFVDVVSRKKA